MSDLEKAIKEKKNELERLARVSMDHSATIKSLGKKIKDNEKVLTILEKSISGTEDTLKERNKELLEVNNDLIAKSGEYSSLVSDINKTDKYYKDSFEKKKVELDELSKSIIKANSDKEKILMENKNSKEAASNAVIALNSNKEEIAKEISARKNNLNLINDDIVKNEKILASMKKEFAKIENEKKQSEEDIMIASRNLEKLQKNIKIAEVKLKEIESSFDVVNKDKIDDFLKRELALEEKEGKLMAFEESLNNRQEGLIDTEKNLDLKEAKLNKLIRRYRIDEEIKKLSS